jgi:hypothetical protein
VKSIEFKADISVDIDVDIFGFSQSRTDALSQRAVPE